MTIFEVTHKRLFCGTFIQMILIGSVILFSCSTKTVSGAGEWWNTNWHFRKPVTIDHTKVDAALDDFPVLISLTDSNLASKAQADGDDIVFTDASRNKLNCEIEFFNGVSGQLVAWVQADLSSTADTTLYMYYGNLDATNQQNAEATWNSNYVLAQHLEEASGKVTDSTSNHNNGDYYGSTQGVTGKIGKADEFDGVNDYIAIPHSASLNLGTNDFTISVWVKYPSTSPNSDSDILRKGNTQDPPSPGKNYKVEVSSYQIAGNLHDNGDSRIQTTTAYGDDNWHFVVFRRQTGTIYLYVDGQLKGSQTDANRDVSNTATFSIGSKNPPVLGDYFDGIIDEVRISKTARSEAWMKADFLSANNGFTTYGTEEAYSTIKSCNSVGTDKDTFTVGQTVYVYGSGYPQANTYNVYIVNDVNDWNSITNIPADVRGAPTTVQTDSSGQIIPKPPTPPAIWTPTSVGQYDIIVDVNNDGKYNAGIDAVDGLDIGTTGLFVIPEYTLGTIIAIAVCFGGVVVYKKFRHNGLKQ